MRRFPFVIIFSFSKIKQCESRSIFIILNIHFFRMNVDRLAFLEHEKTPWLFTSQNLKDLTEITPSVKTRLSMIALIGPRLLDPRAKIDYFLGLFRFSEEKEKVQEILKTRTHVLASSLFRQSGLSLQPMGGGYTDSENSAPRPVIAIPGLAKARAKVTKPLVKLQIKSPGGELPSFAKPPLAVVGKGTPLEKVPEYGQSPNRAVVKTSLEKINESKSASPPRVQPKSITIEKAPRSRSPSPRAVRKEEPVVEVASPPTPTKLPPPASIPTPISPLPTPASSPTPVMLPTPPVVTAAVTPVALPTPAVIVVPPAVPAAVIIAPSTPTPAPLPVPAVVPLTPEVKPVSILKSAMKAPVAKPAPSGPVVNEGVIKMGNMAYNLGPRKSKNAPPAAGHQAVEIFTQPTAVVTNEVHTISDDSDSDYHSEGTASESKVEVVPVVSTPTPVTIQSKIESVPVVSTPTPVPVQSVEIFHASPVVDSSPSPVPRSPSQKPKSLSKMLSVIGRKFIPKSSSGNSPAPAQNSNVQTPVSTPVVSVPVAGPVAGGGNGAPFGGYTMTAVDRETRMQAQMNSSFQDSGWGGSASRRDESLQSPFHSVSPVASPVSSPVDPIHLNGQNGVPSPGKPKKSVRMASPERPEGSATSRERNTRSMSSLDAMPTRTDMCTPDKDRAVNKNNAWRKSTRWEVSVRSIASDFGHKSLDKAKERGLTQQKKRSQTPDRRQQLPRTEEKHNEDEDEEEFEDEDCDEEKDHSAEPAPPPRVTRRPVDAEGNGQGRRRSSNDSLPDKSSSVTGAFTSPIEITTCREVSYYKGMPVEGPIETGPDGTPLFRYQELVRRNVMRSYDGVDHSNLEIHLTDTDFQKVFGMTKARKVIMP